MVAGKISWFMLILSACIFSQTREAYDTKGAIGAVSDSSRFSVHHSMSFGMTSSPGMNMQSQGLYSTLLSYKFSQPVTLNLNFGFPIFSTFSPYGNLNGQNMKSMDYFKNMPVDVSLAWKPTSNLLLQLNVVRNPQYDYFSEMGYPFYSRHLFQQF
jgi:hypothetical protein